MTPKQYANPLFPLENAPFSNHANSMLCHILTSRNDALTCEFAIHVFCLKMTGIYTQITNVCSIHLGILTKTSWKQAKRKHQKLTKKHKLATSQQCENQDPRNTSKCNVQSHKCYISTVMNTRYCNNTHIKQAKHDCVFSLSWGRFLLLEILAGAGFSLFEQCFVLQCFCLIYQFIMGTHPQRSRLSPKPLCT